MSTGHHNSMCVWHKQDRKVSVQNKVEAPYVYLLARSGSAVNDQLLYVATRLKDFAELNNPVAIIGMEYTDTMQIFSGTQHVSPIFKNTAIFSFLNDHYWNHEQSFIL